MVDQKIPVWAKDVANSILQSVHIKDPHTFFHCCRVGRAARRLAKSMGLSDYDQAILEFSGLFHDVGKVGVPDNILLKPGRLNDTEHEVMKSHSEMSVEIIKPMSNHAFFRALIPGIRYHHERFDGSGYPFNLEGENIPLPARVIAVVDTVDAMTNSRPYRKGLPMEIVKEELVRCSGSQFDTEIVQIYLESLANIPAIEEASEDEIVIAQILSPAA